MDGEDDAYEADLYDTTGLDLDGEDLYQDQEPFPALAGESLARTGSHDSKADPLEQLTRVVPHKHAGEERSGDRGTPQDGTSEVFKRIQRLLATSSHKESDIVYAIEKLKAAEGSAQEEVRTLQRREAALQVQLAERTMENMELRRSLCSSWQGAEPSIVQLRQLLLDPAVSKEFTRLKKEVEEADKELQRLRDELEAATFSAESKTGRLLLSKCRALQEENEEMGEELAEGKVARLEKLLALSRAQSDELYRALIEAQEHCSVLEAENEEVQNDAFRLRRQIRELEEKHAWMMNHERRPGGTDGPRNFDRGGAMGRPMERKRPMPDKGEWQQRYPPRKRGR